MDLWYHYHSTSIMVWEHRIEIHLSTEQQARVLTSCVWTLTELKKQHPCSLVISIFHTFVCMCFMSQQRLISPTHCHRIILCNKAQSQSPTKWKKGQIPVEKSSGHSHFYGSQSHRPRRNRWQFITTINQQNMPRRDWRFCKGILCEEYLSEPSNREKHFLQVRKLCWHNRQHFQAGRRCK